MTRMSQPLMKSKIAKLLKNKTILIIGGSGSWGQELTRQILNNHSPKKIIIFSRGEHKQVVMQRKFNSEKLQFIIGDIRDKAALKTAMKDAQIVFHLAALKHVPVCERNPEEAIYTNINGTANAVQAAIEEDIERFVLVSTDKAVDPINTYGVSKSMAEKIVVAGNLKTTKTRFVCIRAGNVLGTNGSVVPLFKQQLERANTITLTDKDMTRYIMRLQDAVRLVFKAFETAEGGEIFVTKMPSFGIMDLIQVMINRFGDKNSKVKIIGIRPGEKLHEVLVSRYEAPRTLEYGNYYVTLPTIPVRKELSKWKGKKLTREYNSDENTMLSLEQIDRMLEKEGIFDDPHRFRNEKAHKEILEIFKREGWSQ